MTDKNENIPFSVKSIGLRKSADGDFYINLKLIPKVKIEEYSKTVVKLTTREKEILKELISGKNNLQIAENLLISVHTVKAHISNIFEKLEVTDRVQAAVKAISENLTDIDYK